MAMERTFALIKPEAVEAGFVADIITELTHTGLEISRKYRLRLTKDVAERLYADHRGRHYFIGTVIYMTASDCVALLITGEDAIQRVDEMKKHIRTKYPGCGGPGNTLHASDCPEAAEREGAIFFTFH